MFYNNFTWRNVATLHIFYKSYSDGSSIKTSIVILERIPRVKEDLGLFQS